MKTKEKFLSKFLPLPPPWTVPLGLFTVVGVVLLAFGFQTKSASATDEVTPDSIVCQATSSENGPYDVYFVLGPWTMGSTDPEDACQHFRYDLEGPEVELLETAIMVTEIFEYYGLCGDNGATKQVCENYGLRITQEDVENATEEDNFRSDCLGVLEDEDEVHLYYLVAGTPCEPYYTHAVNTQ